MKSASGASFGKGSQQRMLAGVICTENVFRKDLSARIADAEDFILFGRVMFVSAKAAAAKHL